MVVNKCDDKRSRAGLLEFYQFGFEPVVEVSAEHGRGIGDLLDEVLKRLGQQAARRGRGSCGGGRWIRDRTRDERPAETAVAIVGRPNVGKSSLVNRLLREERVLVSDMPGTTRDAIDTVLTWRRRQFRIVDTAGIRRPGQVARSGAVENVSVLQAKRAIDRADVVVLVLDAVEGPTDQDAAIAGIADKARPRAHRGGEQVGPDEGGRPAGVRAFDEELARQMKFLDYAPVLHISAMTGERVPKLLEQIDRVADARRRRVPTGELNRFVEAITVGPSAGQQDAARSARALRDADQRRAADVRVLHERGDDVPFFVRAIPGEPAARGVRLRRDAGPHPGAGARASAGDRSASDGVVYSSEVLWLTPWRYRIASGSRPPRCVRSPACSRTCCDRGNSSFPRWASRSRRAARGRIGGPTSSACCGSSSWCSSKG